MSSNLSTSLPRIVDADHPWLGLASFTEETQRFFFGRDVEIADIFVRVREQSLTILYGQSGLGKSSLLGAGLIPKLRVENYRPNLVRLRFESSDPPLLVQIKNHLCRTFDDVRSRNALMSVNTLWEFLHKSDNRPLEFSVSPPVLIFDQLEELFTLGQRSDRTLQVYEVFSQLGDVIENRPPTHLKQLFQADRQLVKLFDLGPSPIRIVLTLREDYLSHLEQWKKMIPSLMRNRMGLQLLNGPQALEAVVRPGNLEGRQLLDSEVGSRIVRFVAGKDQDVPLEEIEAVPPLLSLVCDELNNQRIEHQLAKISTAPFSSDKPQEHTAAGELEQRSRGILQSFYERSFEGQPVFLRDLVEKQMLTDTGHRRPCAVDDALIALTRAGVQSPASCIDSIVNQRLVSVEERGGIQWLEITHDVLAPLIKESRDRRDEERRLREQLDKQRLHEAEQEQQRREKELRDQEKQKQEEILRQQIAETARQTKARQQERRFAVVLLLLVVGMMVALSWALLERSEADKAQSKLSAAQSEIDKLVSEMMSQNQSANHVPTTENFFQKYYAIRDIKPPMAFSTLQAGSQTPKVATSNPTTQDSSEKVPMDKVSYVIGSRLGEQFKDQGVPIDLKALTDGIKLKLSGDTPRYTEQDLTTAMKAFETMMQAKAEEVEKARIANASKMKDEGIKFLTENGKKNGVTTTKSGLQYEVLKEGSGPKPAATDSVKVHYHGTLINGKVFDSSVERGESISFALPQVIKGWTEGLQLMPTGSKFRFFIPSELAYGEQGAGDDIPPGAMLIFEVELLGIEK